MAKACLQQNLPHILSPSRETPNNLFSLAGICSWDNFLIMLPRHWSRIMCRNLFSHSTFSPLLAYAVAFPDLSNLEKGLKFLSPLESAGKSLKPQEMQGSGLVNPFENVEGCQMWRNRMKSSKGIVNLKWIRSISSEF